MTKNNKKNNDSPSAHEYEYLSFNVVPLLLKKIIIIIKQFFVHDLFESRHSTHSISHADNQVTGVVL